MGGFLQQMEEIMDVAAASNGRADDLAIVVDREGGIRMLDPAGWSVSALQSHFAATALFKVERRGQTVRVEGWEHDQRCLLQRTVRSRQLSDLPGFPVAPATAPACASPYLLPAGIA